MMKTKLLGDGQTVQPFAFGISSVYSEKETGENIWHRRLASHYCSRWCDVIRTNNKQIGKHEKANFKCGKTGM